LFDRPLADWIKHKWDLLIRRNIESKLLKDASKYTNKYERIGAELPVKLARADRKIKLLAYRYKFLTGKKF